MLFNINILDFNHFIFIVLGRLLASSFSELSMFHKKSPPNLVSTSKCLLITKNLLGQGHGRITTLMNFQNLPISRYAGGT